MKIVVTMTLELPVEVPDDFQVNGWLNGDSLCLNSLLPPNEYHQCICDLARTRSWRLPRVEDEELFDDNPFWESGECKPKEGVDC